MFSGLKFRSRTLLGDTSLTKSQRRRSETVGRALLHVIRGRAREEIRQLPGEREDNTLTNVARDEAKALRGQFEKHTSVEVPS